MKVLKYLLLLIAIFAVNLMPVAKCDEDEAVVVVVVEDEEEMINLGRKTIIDAPVFCPSNYRLDHRGKCRRIVP